MNRIGWLGLVVVLAAGAALALRLPELARRPMHVDEAVHAAKVGELLEHGQYIYDPNEYHGPSLYYLTLPFIYARGISSYAELTEPVLRLVPALFGTGLILVIWLLRKDLGRCAAGGAALLAAVSPAMVYYSRYYIQEILLVFFTYFTIWALWRYVRQRRLLWALLAGLGAALMHATKETDSIAFACIAGAALLNLLWERLWRPRRQAPQEANQFLIHNYLHHPEAAAPADRAVGRGAGRITLHILAGLSLAALITSWCYSAAGKNWQGPLNSFLTYRNYFQRVGSAGLHDHPWYYYGQLLIWSRQEPGPVWSEVFILLLGVMGLVFALKVRYHISNIEYQINLETPSPTRDVGLVRFIAFFTALMAGIYSAIDYKTPWCMLSFLFGFILLAGYGAGEILRRLRLPPLQAVAGVLLMAGVLNLGWQAERAAFRFCADPRNPYVYAHSTPDVVRIGEQAAELARLHPAGFAMPIQVIAPQADYWPLPWYLRKFRHVGFWDAPPARLNAPVIIAAAQPDLAKLLEPQLSENYFEETLGLRPHVRVNVFIEKNLWAKYLAKRSGQK